MSYLVLARKWRPSTFAEITGQEHVTRTLTHAIEQDRVHHAFLFCGARGVGKTTAARVLAKALNCEQGPTPTPCGTCRACVEIAAGGAIDVFEIDGASNRGIGEIRELREGVAYAPQRDRFKIYIIDEVHMLTTEAFNALLKTLEEPPPHVKFIFATTEPQKIPVTILSRCQRFDFKRIPLEVMAGRLAEILAAEGVTMAEGALRLVARESEGSMRDALSLLDRIISFCGTEATYDDVAGILGVADRTWLARLVEAALSHDAPAALAVVRDVFTYGVDLKQFATDLVHYLRDIVVLRVAGQEGALTDLADEERVALGRLGAGRPIEDLERLFNLASRTAERLSQAAFPRLELEMAVIRMCRLRPLQPIGAMVERLAAIERHLETGTPLPPPVSLPPMAEPVAGGAGPAAAAPRRTAAPPAPAREEAPAPRAPERAEEDRRAEDARPAEAPAAEAPAAEAPTAEAASEAPAAEAPADGPPDEEPDAGDGLVDEQAAADALVEEQAAEHVAAALPEDAPPPPRPAPAPEARPAPVLVLAPEVPVPEAAAGAAPAEPAAPPAAGPAPVTFDQDAWEAFLDGLRREQPALVASLDHGQVASWRDGTLAVGFAGAFNLQAARSARAAVLGHLRRLVGDVTAFEAVPVDGAPDSPYERRRKRAEASLKAKREAIAAHPLVQAVVERFDGRLAQVHVEGESPEEGSG